MKAHRFVVNTRPREWHYLTPISDAHLDSASCDVDALKALLKERSELPNHRFISLGDMGDWILPKDQKRYQPAVSVDKLRGKDAFVNEALDYHASVLQGYRWDLLASGNHENALLRHHAIDVTELLAERLGARAGGYCGYLIYSLRGPANVVIEFSILYHHGRWGGRVVKGFGGLRDWSRMFDNWDVVLAGHNHHMLVHKEARLRPHRQRDDLVARECYMAFCGTHHLSYAESPGSGPRYEELAGHPPVSVGAPLLKFRYHHHNHAWARKKGRPGDELEIRVEI